VQIDLVGAFLAAVGSGLLGGSELVEEGVVDEEGVEGVLALLDAGAVDGANCIKPCLLSSFTKQP
jgi:hypothetical protein